MASWHVPFIFSVHTLINFVLVSMDPSSLKVHTLVASLFLTVSGWVGLVEPPLPAIDKNRHDWLRETGYIARGGGAPGPMKFQLK